MEEKKTNDNKIKKAGIAVLSVSVLTAGTAGLVSAYQSGNDYKPADSDRDIQKNQVVFDDKDDTVGHKKKKSKDESELLKKDKDTQKGANQASDSNYLFEKQNMLMPDGVTTVGVADGNLTGTMDMTNNNMMYGFTDDPSRANLLLNGGGVGNGNSGMLAGNSGNNNLSGNKGNAGTSGQGSNGQNGNNSSSGDQNSGQTDDPQTPVRPADRVKDPESEKNTPGGYYEFRPFKDGVKPSDKGTEERPSVVIQQVDDADASQLYKGQTADQKTIYNALDTYVLADDGVAYVWGADALDKYVKITAVSFDGGMTWTDTFPVTIPENVESGQMKIKVEYRLSVNDTQWTEKIVDYDVRDIRLFILARQLTDDDERIDPDIILNPSQQYPENGKVINLFKEQDKILTDETLTELFPGWTENGKLVPWYYTVTAGRHILEPADKVPIDSKYVVKMQLAWMSDDYKVGNEYSNLAYLQTLTDIDSPVSVHWTDPSWHDSWFYDKVSVPEYVQAVMIDEDAAMSVNYLEIPDTVLYVQTENSGMRVNEGYVVDENNLNYDATEDGMLTNKDNTAILSIPYEKEEITIPEGIRSVKTEKKNKIQTIHLEAESLGEIPDINYNELSGCKILMQDDIMESFLANNQEAFTKTSGNTVAAEGQPDVTYAVQKGIITDNSGKVRKVLDNGNISVTLDSDMELIENGAFEGVSSVNALVMPKDGKEIKLEAGCFEGSQLKAIRCYTQKQYDSIMAQLENAGAPEDIQVELLQMSEEGYWYVEDTLNGREEAVLIEAPEKVEEFDGTIIAKDGSAIDISVIGDDAFADCSELKWAILPEKVDTIGYRAFENCTSLEGVLINNRESITIGNEAWDGCTGLRFIASNAMNCTLKNDYDPYVTDSYGSTSQQRYFFAPTNSEGYGNYYVAFNEESNVAGYTVCDLGTDGKMLYGTDENGQPWLALRSGKTVPDTVEFESNTKELYRYAMADTQSESGTYTVNFKTSDIWAIDTGAFYNSELGGDLELNDNSYLFDYAMSRCPNITSVRMPGENILFGEGAVCYSENLKSVYIGKLRENIEFCAGSFSGCDSLTDITFEDEIPPFLFLYNASGSPYQFNYDWTPEEEAENLRLHIPESAWTAYIKEWRYAYIGYVDSGDSPAYLTLWNDVYYDNINWDTGEVPENSAVDQVVEEKVLEAENRVRKMIGAQNAPEPTEYYPYHVVNNELVMLAGAPSDTTELDLGDTVSLDLPDGWFLDGIESGAFSRCSSLQKVTIPSNMVEIESGAFQGVNSGTLTLEFADGGDPTTLKCEEGTPFSFGVDDSNLYLTVPEGREDEYIKSWVYPMEGFSDLDAMRASVKEALQADNPDVTDAQVDEEIARRLLPVENRLRTMMHLNTVEELDKDKYGLNTEGEAPVEEVETDASDAEMPDDSGLDHDISDVDISDTDTEKSVEDEKEIPQEDTMTSGKEPADTDIKEKETQVSDTAKNNINGRSTSMAGDVNRGEEKEK